MKEILKAIDYRLKILRKTQQILNSSNNAKYFKFVLDTNEARIDELETLKMYMKKIKLTITKEQLRVKPRLGIQKPKVFKDKTKYSRKRKHKDEN